MAVSANSTLILAVQPLSSAAGDYLFTELGNSIINAGVFMYTIYPGPEQSGYCKNYDTC